MKKKLLQFIFLFTIVILNQGCTKQTCLEKDVHNGLYNALTCDYQSRVIQLKKTIINNSSFLAMTD